MKKLNSNILRIGEFRRVIHGKVQLIIPEQTYHIEIILLEQLIGDYKITSVDLNNIMYEDLDDEGDYSYEDYCEEFFQDDIFYFVQTNIPWEEYYLTPNPDLKYLNRNAGN